MEYTPSAYAILGILTFHPHQSGYHIRKTVECSVGFFWGESYGQIYPTLRRLAADGLIRLTNSGSKEARKRQEYSITEEGKTQLQRWLSEPYHETPLRDEFLLKLFFGVEAGIESSIAQIKRFQQRVRGSLQTVEGIEHLARAQNSNLPGFPYWMLTLSYGVTQMRSALEWCDSALATLKTIRNSASHIG